MKNFMKINRALLAKKNFMMLIMAVVLVALPTMAQQQEWQSTSSMQGTGSSLAPQVTAVGATTVGEMATTTENYSPAQAGQIRRSKEKNTELLANPGSPIGDALLPLSLLVCAYLGTRVFLKRKRALKS